MKRLVILFFILAMPCFSFALEQMTDKELDNIVAASIVDLPSIAQEAGGNATMFNDPVAMTQRTAEDVQTLTRPGTFANKVSTDTQTILSPSSSAQAVAAGFSF